MKLQRWVAEKNRRGKVELAARIPRGDQRNIHMTHDSIAEAGASRHRGGNVVSGIAIPVRAHAS